MKLWCSVAGLLWKVRACDVTDPAKVFIPDARAVGLADFEEALRHQLALSQFLKDLAASVPVGSTAFVLNFYSDETTVDKL